MRELNVNEIQEVNGGMIPLIWVAYAVGVDIGLNLALFAFSSGARNK